MHKPPNHASKRINLLIIDAHPLFRRGIRQAFSAQPYVNSVQDIPHTDFSASSLNKGNEDIILLGISTSGSIMDSCRSIVRNHHLNMQIIVMNRSDEMEHASELVSMGAIGQISKSLAEQAFLLQFEAITKVVASPPNERLALRKSANLGKREIQIIDMLSKALTSKEIATTLNLSKHTVDNHRKRILRKTGLANTTGVIAWALESGLIGS